MRIKTFGAKHFTGQLPRIEEGFRVLGHEIVEENPDLVYANNPPFQEAINSVYGDLKNHPIVIFNVLDIPEHLFPNYNLESLRRELIFANAVTSISKTTQAQLKKFLDLDSAIIYQPAMPVFQTNEKKYHDFEYLIVGRVNDPNKRTRLLYRYLRQYNPKAHVTVLGSEDPGFGTYWGVVSNKELNNCYNSADYIFSLTKYGGIELSQIEAILAGKFPIVCNDSEVAMEFNPEFACGPTPDGIHKKIIEIEENKAKYIEIVKRKQTVYSKRFDKIEVAKKILSLIE